MTVCCDLFSTNAKLVVQLREEAYMYMQTASNARQMARVTILASRPSRWFSASGHSCESITSGWIVEWCLCTCIACFFLSHFAFALYYTCRSFRLASSLQQLILYLFHVFSVAEKVLLTFHVFSLSPSLRKHWNQVLHNTSIILIHVHVLTKHCESSQYFQQGYSPSWCRTQVQLPNYMYMYLLWPVN